MIRIENWVCEEEAIGALNVKPPEPSRYASFLRRYLQTSELANTSEEAVIRDWETSMSAHFPNEGERFIGNYLWGAPYPSPPLSYPDGGWRLPVTIARRESRLISNALLSAHLRTYIDAWLDTGRDPSGSESPQNRTLPLATTNPLYSYLKDHPASYSPTVDAHGFRLIMARPNSRAKANDFFQAQRLEAQRLLVGIMVADWRYRLCKCRYKLCGRYFMHSKPRPAYRNGTFCCRNHQSRASGAAQTDLRRQNTKRDLIKRAGEWLVKKHATSDWQSSRRLKDSLAAYLTSCIAGDPNLHGLDHVKVGWVTRNRALIEHERIQLAEDKTE